MGKFKKKADDNLPVKSGSNLPTNVSMSDFGGAGSEDIGIEDLPRPTLKLLQGTSYECTVGHEKFIEGAKPGTFFNASTLSFYSSTLETVKGGLPNLILIPIKYARREVEFGRGRGGFMGEHLPGSEITEGITIVEGENGKKHRITTNDTELVDTRIFYGIIIHPESNEGIQCIISLSSTAIRFAKDFNAFMGSLIDVNEKGKSYKPALFSRAYTLYSVMVNGKKGSYFTWKFQPNCVLDLVKHRTLIEDAVGYYNLINNDQVIIDHNQE